MRTDTEPLLMLEPCQFLDETLVRYRTSHSATILTKINSLQKPMNTLSRKSELSVPYRAVEADSDDELKVGTLQTCTIVFMAQFHFG